MFLNALQRDPQLAARRGDFRDTVMSLARIYARHASWADMTTWRPREDIRAEIGSPRDRSRPLSVTAYRAARRWLQDHGYLGLISPGWTSALRAAVLDDGDQLCPVYVLAIPRPKTRHISHRSHQIPPGNRALTSSRSEVVKAPARARGQTRGKPGQDHDGPRSARAAFPPPAEVIPRGKTQTRSDARAAAQVILERCRVLRPLTAEHAASVIRPWTAAGWAPGDLLWAVAHQPPDAAGRCRLHGYTAGVRHPAAWLRWRLSLWTDPAGAPLQAPSRRHAAERARDRAEQRARHTQRTDPAGGAAQHARRAARQAAGLAPTLRDIFIQARRRPGGAPPSPQRPAPRQNGRLGARAGGGGGQGLDWPPGRGGADDAGMEPDPAAARSLAAQVATVLDLARAERSAASGAAAAGLDEVIAALEPLAAQVTDLAGVHAVLQVAARHGSGPHPAPDLATFTGLSPAELHQVLTGMIRDGLAERQQD